MKIEQLKYLIEVVKSGSINSASKKLFISQQSLSQSLRSLEYELGFDILTRTKKGATLTERGREVYSAGQAIVARYEQMMETVQKIRPATGTSLSGQLTIYASPMIGVCLLPVVYVEYMHVNSKVQVYCREDYQIDIVRRVSENPGDLGYVLVANTMQQFFSSIPENVSLELLQAYPIYMAMSPRHPLSQHRNLSLQAIRDYPLIVFEVGGPEGEHALQNEVNLKVLLSTNNYNMIQELLNEGHSMIYSYRPYMARGVFKDCVHIPLHVKDTVFQLYRVTNKKATEKQKELTDSFNLIMLQYI